MGHFWYWAVVDHTALLALGSGRLHCTALVGTRTMDTMHNEHAAWPRPGRERGS